MTPAQIALAKRLADHQCFVFTVGMRGFFRGLAFRVVLAKHHETLFAYEQNDAGQITGFLLERAARFFLSPDMYPNLDDDATIGALIGMLRKLTDDPFACAVPYTPLSADRAEWWTVAAGERSKRRTLASSDHLGEAVALAILEAMK